MSKDYLRRETNAIFSTLRSRSNFFRNDSSKRKRFHLSAKKLHDKCSASVSVELQQGSYEKLNVGIFLQDYLQRNASQVPNMMCLWKMITVLRSLILNSYPHITSHVFLSPHSPNLSNIYGERNFVSWKNIHFCGLTLIWVSFLGVRFEVGGGAEGVKLPSPLSKTC